MAETRIAIKVVYATAERQVLVAVELSEPATIKQALLASGLLTKYPELDWGQTLVGVFGKQCTLDHLLNSGDRVEIYRPLLVEPKQARRRRAKEQ